VYLGVQTPLIGAMLVPPRVDDDPSSFRESVHAPRSDAFGQTHSYPEADFDETGMASLVNSLVASSTSTSNR
jgi:hypothetical protein